MDKPSDKREDWQALRQRLIGLGEQSIQKSYYPELKRRLAELERFRALLDQSNDLILLLEHPSGRVLDANETALKRLGLRLEELRESGIVPLLTPRDRRAFARFISNEDPLEGEVLTVTGDLKTASQDALTVEMSIRRVRLGEGAYSVIVARDVSDRARAEAALRESEEKYRLVVDNAHEAIFVLQNGMIQFPNPSACAILCHTPEEFASSPFMDHVYPADRPLIEDIESLAISGSHTPRNLSFRIVDARGQLHWLILNGVAIRWEGRPATLCILHDISEQKRLEESLAHAQRMEAIGTLAGGIAHDFNNLLQIIHGFTELELLNPLGAGVNRQALTHIKDAVARGRDLTSRLLTFSRKLESRRQIVNLNTLIVDMEMMLERTIPKMIGIELRLTGSRQCVHADPTQLEQVIMNLALNARDAMPEGGRLVLETDRLILDSTAAQGYPPLGAGKYVRLRVTDTGHGIPDEIRAHIFDPFFTTKEIGRGTGLGLATVYGIVRQHGGAVFCHSTPGTGTTFEVLVPWLEEEARHERESAEPERATGTETILLVEDEPSLLDMGKEILTRYGYTVHVARDGESALQIMRERGGEVDLVILDLIMPGMGGIKCLGELLLMDPETRVLITSGYAQDSSEEDLLLLGARAFIPKPYTVSQLLQGVRKVLDAYSSSA